MLVNKKHYFCDGCKKEVTDTQHFHLEDVRWFGFVTPPKFEMKSLLGVRYFDFCGVPCLLNFIVKSLKKSKKKIIKK